MESLCVALREDRGDIYSIVAVQRLVDHFDRAEQQLRCFAAFQ